MTEEPLGPRRAHPSANAPRFDEADPLAPRRAAAPPTRARRSHEPGINQWAVVGAFGLVIAVMVAVFYGVFGVHPPAGDAPTALRTPAAAPPSAEPSPTPSPAGAMEIVGDTALTIPAHWRLYADQVTEGDRRLIRVIEDETDVRLQVATLTTVGTDLPAACRALISDQGAAYAVDFEVSPRYLSMDDGALAVTCGFVGSRTDQATDTSVMFTMIQRESDLHTLVLRVMQPRALPAESPSAREVTSMSCEAAAGFGHPFPLC